MKTTKEYAKELVENYKLIVCFDTAQAKQCALIDVQNTIDAFPSEYDTEYFEQVKTEINNLK